MTQPNDILQMLVDDVVVAAQQILIRSGVDNNSDLIKSLDVDVKNNAITLIAAEYYEYVSTGRRPNARKVPIQDLIKWIKDKGVRPRAGQSTNQLAFAIQTSIFKNGIRGKKYTDQVESVTLEVLEEEFTQILSEVITKELKEKISLN